MYIVPVGVDSMETYGNLTFEPLISETEEIFIALLQESFQVAVDEEFGPDAGTAIPREDIERSIHGPGAQSWLVTDGGETVGGVNIRVIGNGRADLDLLFVRKGFIGNGYGKKIWDTVESMFPEVEVWETHTPYFERRNIHFYVNKCGFHIVEFYCEQNPMGNGEEEFPGNEYFFRFEKAMGKR